MDEKADRAKAQQPWRQPPPAGAAAGPPDADPLSVGEEPTVVPGATPQPGTRPPGAAARRLREGDLVLNRYRVTGELGQGGMGAVYRCHDRTSGIDVALKAIPPELSRNSSEMEEVRENFRLVEKLHHPGIAAAKTLERDPATGDYYLIMECVEGISLRQVRKRCPGGRLSLDEALPLLRQIGTALDYAHAVGIIHRDIKPANVLLTAGGSIKVLDFGLASQIHTSLSRVSQVHFGTSGTGPYMAPEQWRGQYQDAATDQYALASLAYELLAGRTPFENAEAAILREAVLNDTPEPVAGLPATAQQALARGMAKARADRFASCTDFVEALAGGRPAVGIGTASAWRKAAWPVAAAVCALVLLGFVAVFLWYGRKQPGQPTTTGQPQTVGQQPTAPVPTAPSTRSAPLSGGGAPVLVPPASPESVLPAVTAAPAPAGARPVVPAAQTAPTPATAAPVTPVPAPRAEPDKSLPPPAAATAPAPATAPADAGPVTPAAPTTPPAVATAIEVAPVVPVPGPGPVTPGPPPPSGPLTIGRDWTVPDLGMEFVWLRDLKCWVGRYEVTNAEFRRFRSEHSSQDYKGQTLDADRQPAVRVRLDDARAFAQWLTSREQQAGRLLSRYEYRLPVWKEWVEFAVCHSHRLYPWGNEWPPRYGNFGDETAAKLLSVDGIAGYSDGFAVSCPVDESGRSDWGLYGVAGNAWEWTADGATGSPQGGSWRFSIREALTCKYRQSILDSSARDDVGFRLVLSR